MAAQPHQKNTKEMTMIIVDRDSFIAWTQGILLDRKADGTFVCGDNELNKEAEEALKNGKTIGLTVEGRIVSTMSLDEETDSYREYFSFFS